MATVFPMRLAALLTSNPATSSDLTLRFRATTPHNPSFWQIYLSKPGFDAGSGDNPPPLWFDNGTYVNLQTPAEVGARG